jgi:MerR family transcriptional regulator, light-induced transcriptional regulator
VIAMQGAIRIGELARRVGVSPEVLRAWETRYGLLQPTRSDGGFRLYSAADEARVRRMTRLIADGVAPAEAARLALTGDEQPTVVEAPIVDQLSDRLRSALDAFDGAGAHAAFDRLLASVSVDVVLADVVLPYLRDLGDRWAAGRASVAQEHFASNLIRGRLLALARDWDTGEGPTLLLACLPGEAHDLGLIVFGLLMSRRGWRVTFLGADTPVDTLRSGIRTVQPTLAVLVATTSALLDASADAIRAFSTTTSTAIAGIEDRSAIADLGAIALPPDIVEAARSMAS